MNLNHTGKTSEGRVARKKDEKNQKMKKEDKIILKELQNNFPLTKNPYRLIAEKLSISEKRLLTKIKNLKQKRIIRRIGGVVSGRHLGFKSVLIAAKLDDQNLNKNISFINSFNNITHNYLRKDEYNVWFTFSARTKKQINQFLFEFKKRKGVEKILVLPSEKTFKINTEFKF
ncbi:MAG: Lrp/AsnC family transcriptional regulator [Candidatus Omnitrophota bacterium]